MAVVLLNVGGESILPASISLDIGADKAARSFQAELVGPRWQMLGWITSLAQSPPATITYNGVLAFTGHVEKVQPRFDAGAYSLSISGRSKTGDLVDSSHNHKTSEFKKKAPKAILSDIVSEHGVAVEGQGGARVRDLFRLNPGETIYSAVERLGRRDGFTACDTPEGNLHLFDAPTESQAGSLIEGVHFQSGSATFDASKRFAKTQVKAQAPVDHGPDNLEIDIEETDPSGARARRKVIVAPEFLRKDEAKKRAAHARDRSAGRGITCEFVIAGWTDDGGQIWQPRKLIYVESPSLGLSQVMMIETARLSLSERDGTQAALSFVDPRAYGGKGGKGSKSAKVYDLKGAGAS
jgi:prophage tail gpP-like protein